MIPETNRLTGSSSRFNIVSFNPKPRDFTPHNFTCERRSPTPPEHPERFNEIELHLIKSGSITYLFGGEEVTFEPGRLALFWGASSHQIIKSASQVAYHVIKIPLTWFLQCQFPGEFVRPILHGQAVADPVPDGQVDIKQFDRWIQNIQSQEPSAHRITQLELEARLLRMALCMDDEMDLDQANQADSTSIGSNQVRRVGQMVSFIAENYTKHVSVELVSKFVGLHPHYAMNLFRRTLGTTLINCVTHHRIAHAQRLLITTDKKIVDVALTVGFNSISRFNAAFKKASDCSPREYREIHKNANHEFTFSGRLAN
jgi:AraC family transcriptional regulator, melibiose operon regulatory protein